MTRPWRGAGVALLACVLAAGCQPSVEGIKKIGLVPDHASLVVGIDVKALGKTPLGTMARSGPTRPVGRAYQEMTDAIGFDFLADVDEVRIGVPTSRVRGSLSVLRGRFDPERSLAAVAK